MPPFEACCAHDHDCAAEDCGPEWSLHKHIDIPNVRCLNEATESSAKGVFRPWGERLDFSGPPLASNEDDEELLIHVPFNGSVKIKAICIIGAPDGYSPAELRVYTNRDDLDFGAVQELPPVQKWELAENLQGQIELPTQVTKFAGVHSLDLYIPRSLGAPETRIHFIGIKGEFTERRREAVIAVYEARAVPTDHKVPGSDELQSWGAAT